MRISNEEKERLFVWAKILCESQSNDLSIMRSIQFRQSRFSNCSQKFRKENCDIPRVLNVCAAVLEREGRDSILAYLRKAFE